MSAGCTGAFIDRKNSRGGRRTVLYKNDVFQTLWRQMLMARNEEVFFDRPESGSRNTDEVKFHPENPDWLE